MLSRVVSRARSSSRRTDSSSSSTRPMVWKRMPFLWMLSSSRRTYSLSRLISVRTSERGRFQFSTEKAYSVRTPSPSRAEVSTVSRTESMPARCPATRGRCRCPAQRPLPSMITAMCRGRRLRSIFSSSLASTDPRLARPSRSAINSFRLRIQLAILAQLGSITVIAPGGTVEPWNRWDHASIAHPDQNETAGGSGEAGCAPVAFLKELAELLEPDAPAPKLQQSACDVARHVMQEAVRLDRQEQAPSLSPQVGAKDAPDRAALGRRSAVHAPGEASEVVAADQKRRGPRHGSHVDGEGIVVVFARQVRRQDFAAVDLILVDLRVGGVPGVELRRRAPGREDADVLGEQTVERPAKIARRDARRGPEVRDQAARMGPGVGPSAADQGHLVAGDMLERFGQDPLDRRQPLLDLPAVVARPGESDREPDVALPRHRLPGLQGRLPAA